MQRKCGKLRRYVNARRTETVQHLDGEPSKPTSKGKKHKSSKRGRADK